MVIIVYFKKRDKSVKRPPAEWWAEMMTVINKRYPRYTEKRKSRIVAGIWHKLPTSKRLKILKKYPDYEII